MYRLTTISMSFALWLCAERVLATGSASANCTANLKQIDGAIQQWALENKVASTNTTQLDTNPPPYLEYLRGSTMPICPRGGKYSAGRTVADSPSCSFHGATWESAWAVESEIRRKQGWKDAVLPALLCIICGLVVTPLSRISNETRKDLAIFMPLATIALALVAFPVLGFLRYHPLSAQGSGLIAITCFCLSLYGLTHPTALARKLAIFSLLWSGWLSALFVISELKG